jgi:hypothetical protein
MKPKSKNTANTTPTASSTDASLLTLAALNDLAVGQRVELYVTTENRQRIGFLLQGKILHSLGVEGLELLRAAGIKPSSLANARKAEWVIGTFTHPEATKTIQELRFHNGTEAAAFSEELYDTLTLRQCELLRIGFTTIGQHTHRPTPQQATELLAASPDWEDDFESILDTGLTRAGLEAKRAADQLAVEAERTRIADLERQIAESQERDRLAAETALNAPPPPPIVSFNPAPVAAEDADTDTDTDDEPAEVTSTSAPADNIVAFTVEDADEPETEVEQSEDEDEESRLQQEQDDEQPPVEVESDDDDTTDSVTPEEIGDAVAAATAGILEHNQGVIEHLGFTLHDLEDGFADNVAGLDLTELTDIQSRLQRLLDAVNLTIASKAAPPEPIYLVMVICPLLVVYV